MGHRHHLFLNLAGLTVPGGGPGPLSAQGLGLVHEGTLSSELALDVLLVESWHRKPKQRILVHSDQGSKYGSDRLRSPNLELSKSRRGTAGTMPPLSHASAA